MVFIFLACFTLFDTRNLMAMASRPSCGEPLNSTQCRPTPCGQNRSSQSSLECVRVWSYVPFDVEKPWTWKESLSAGSSLARLMIAKNLESKSMR